MTDTNKTNGTKKYAILVNDNRYDSFVLLDKEYLSNGIKLQIVRQCPLCGRTTKREFLTSVDVFMKCYERWQSGELIQDAFNPWYDSDEKMYEIKIPWEIRADINEFIKTGFCNTCMHEIFGCPDLDDDVVDEDEFEDIDLNDLANGLIQF